MPVLFLACHLPHNTPNIPSRYNNEQTTKQTKAINNSYIYISHVNVTQTVPDISPLMPMHQDPLLVTYVGQCPCIQYHSSSHDIWCSIIRPQLHVAVYFMVSCIPYIVHYHTITWHWYTQTVLCHFNPWPFSGTHFTNGCMDHSVYMRPANERLSLAGRIHRMIPGFIRL